MTIRPIAAAALLSATLGTACSTWHWQAEPPRGVLERKQPERVRVMLPDSSKVVVWRPTMARDTLLGFAADTAGAEPVAVPVADIRRVDVYGPDAGATLLLIVGVAVAAVLYLASQISEI